MKLRGLPIMHSYILKDFFPLPDFVVCLVNKLVHGIPSKLAEEEKEEGEEVEVVGMRARGEKEEKASN